MDADDVRRKFDSMVSGLDLDDLREIAGMIAMGMGSVPPHRGARPALRRPRLADAGVFRIRVDLDGADPAIWRRLDVRSDITLADMHQVLQAAYGWLDMHLHRFSIGGGPWDDDSELFLCPFDVEEGEDEGTPASEVRLDEVIQQPGDVLHYAYDYGDGWEVSVRLEEVRDAASGLDGLAVCIDGGRAAPPEDSRGMDDEELFEIRGDPEAFSVDDVNDALTDPYFVLREQGAGSAAVDIVTRLRGTSAEGDVLLSAMALLDPEALDPEPLEERERDAALGAFRWFLARAKGGGIPLTDAGYLRPADVVEASRVVPAMGDWIGANNREAHAAPLLEFRKMLVTLGLLRKHRGTLLLGRAGAAGDRSAGALWTHLVVRVRGIVDGTHAPFRGRAGSLPAEFSHDATVLILLAAAGTGHGDGAAPPHLDLDRVARWLTELGWRTDDGTPVEGWGLHDQPVLVILDNLSATAQGFGRPHGLSPVAAAFAREVLRAN